MGYLFIFYDKKNIMNDQQPKALGGFSKIQTIPCNILYFRKAY